MDRNKRSICRIKVCIDVALRKESVDRNKELINKSSKLSRSLSARRAWIEIEEVENYEEQTERRSPQGERG